MRAALECLPWTLPKEDEPEGVWDCAGCLKRTTPAIRKGYHCGWLDPKEWQDIKPEYPRSFGGRPYECDRCPGWAIRQPEVTEACSAYAAYQKGALAVFFPDARNDLLEACQILEASFHRYEAEQMRLLKAKS